MALITSGFQARFSAHTADKKTVGPGPREWLSLPLSEWTLKVGLKYSTYSKYGMDYPPKRWP